MSRKGPFSGYRFCSTAIPSDVKADLAGKIKSMGGVHFNNLMSDITHLIVGDKNTEKYTFAVKKRSDVSFISASIIFTLHAKWISGTDEEIVLNDHSLPIFDGLTVCLSRITSPKFDKAEIIKYIRSNGGDARDSLTMSSSCMITTDKSGKRYDKALEWNIPIIDPLWVLDSIKRRASLDMKYYDLTKQITIGKDSCDVWNDLSNNKKRYLDIEVVEPIPIKKLKGTTKIWNSIMETTQSITPAIRKRELTWGDDNQSDEDEDEDEDEQEEAISNLNRYDRNNEPEEPATSSIFMGFNFAIHGFEKDQISTLKKVIRSHRGEVSNISDYTITHLIIPTTMDYKKLPMNIKTSLSNEVKIVTEWFVERCLYFNEIKSDKWGTPLKHLNININLKICISGFTGIELLHLTKLIKIIGGTRCDTLTSDRDLLVINISMIKSLSKNSPKLFQYKYPEILKCPNDNKLGIVSTRNKINAAKKWDIPIVSIAYLWETVEIGKSPNLLDLQWCIFAPKNCSKPRNLMEYVKTLSGTTFETPNKAVEPTVEPAGETTEEITADTISATKGPDLPQLPSPRKNKRKEWGRLIGRATESLESLEQPMNELDNEEENGHLKEPFSTQITYEHPNSINEEIEPKPGRKKKTKTVV